jgi:hypothetical protein
MSTVEMLEEIQGIVASALNDARNSLFGIGPEPDPEVVALRIMHVLTQALRYDPAFRNEVRRAMVPIPV